MPPTSHRLTATRDVEVPAGSLFDALADVRRHHALACDRIEVVDVSEDADGRMLGVIVLRGPLGIRRRITTRELSRHSPILIEGLAASGAGSVAEVSWQLVDVTRERTRVTLSVVVTELGALDRALLALGGRRILVQSLKATLRRLDGLVPALESAPG